MSATSPLRIPLLVDEAYYGIAGRIVRAVEPHSEADPAALMAHVLAAAGNLIGRTAWFSVGGQRHHANLFAAMVGATSSGRKGTAKSDALHAFGGVDDNWLKDRQLGGMSTGEGLIWAVRDEIRGQERDRKKDKLVEVVIDPGVTDKRIFVVESEFAAVLKRMSRDCNTVSMILRQAWDGGKLATMTKGSPATATDAHVSVIAHITLDELRRKMAVGEAFNGFVNRFLWFAVHRSKLLPDGGRLEKEDFKLIREELGRVLAYAKAGDIGEIVRDVDANSLWHEVYATLVEDRPGTFGAVTARAAPQVMRLAVIYAALDMASIIRLEHLRAALAVWRFCEDSARCLFGPPESPEVRERRELFQWIAGKGGRITAARLAHGPRTYRGQSEKAEAVLQALVDAGFGSWEPVHSGPQGGKPTKVFCMADSPDFPIDRRGVGTETSETPQRV